MTASLPVREPLPVEAVPVNSGFRARFQKPTGGREWVRLNGEPQVFATELEAENAAWKARELSTRGHGILSTGEKAKARAERLLHCGKNRHVPMVTISGKPVDACELRAQLKDASHRKGMTSYNVKHELDSKIEAVKK